MDSVLHQKLEQLILESMTDGLVPGMAVVVVQGQETVFSQGYGFANLETRTPFTPDTRCHIGSTTKALTAVAVMQLLEGGSIELDALVTTYLPDFRVKDPRGSSITVRHLLTNSSGLAGSAILGSVDDDALEHHVKGLANVALEYEPGNGYLYANSGWSVLGLIVQRLSGMSFEHYMQEKVFAILEMNASTLEYWQLDALGGTRSYHEGTHTRHLARPPGTNRGYAPAGMAVSSANDVSKYLRMLLNNGLAANGTRILSEASVKEIMRGQVAGESSVGLEGILYAFGWETLERHGVKAVEHGGSVGTMGSYFMLAPENEFAIGVLFNLVDNAKMQLIANLFNAITKNPIEPYQSLPRPEVIPCTDFVADQRDLERVTGTYPMPYTGEVRVYFEHVQMMIEVQHETHKLEPRALHSFISRSEVLALEGLEHTFVFSDAGVELHVHTEYGDVEIGTRKETA